MNKAPCDKLILAEAAGFRLIYCKNCDVIELEAGAISLRLTPEMAQQMANAMMKACLKLDRMTRGLHTTDLANTAAVLH